ncbi:MAG TPA: hypothetical protein VJU61_24770, partial [Polyangiaceae bacterium]|nr:hypothetical protein [Polyangiaceae bacterium]
ERGHSYLHDAGVSSIQTSFWAGPTARGNRPDGTEAETAYMLEYTTNVVFTGAATHRARCVR